jgi:hypothetical protein
MFSKPTTGDPRGPFLTSPLGANFDPRGEFCPLEGEVIPWGWNSPFTPPFFKTVECSPLRVNKGVNISPRGQISPLVAKFAPGSQGWSQEWPSAYIISTYTDRAVQKSRREVVGAIKNRSRSRTLDPRLELDRHRTWKRKNDLGCERQSEVRPSSTFEESVLFSTISQCYNVISTNFLFF